MSLGTAFRNCDAEMSPMGTGHLPLTERQFECFLEYGQALGFWQKVDTKQVWHLGLKTVRKLSGYTRLFDNFVLHFFKDASWVKVRDSSAFLLLLLISIQLLCCCKIEKLVACQKMKGNEIFEEHGSLAALLENFQCPHVLGLKGNLSNSSPLGIAVCSRVMPLNTSSTLNHDW